MPNHCSNLLLAFDREGSIVDIPKKYLYDADAESVEGNEGISFDKVLPLPELLQKVNEGRMEIDGVAHDVWIEEKSGGRALTDDELAELNRIGYKGWYSWSIANWGCKWDAYDGEMIGKGCRFSTAWSPPLKVIRELSVLEPDLYFYIGFDEPGCDFAGHELYKEGKLLASENIPSPEGRIPEDCPADEAGILHKYTNPCSVTYALGVVRYPIESRLYEQPA